jgi:hypothetical protein
MEIFLQKTKGNIINNNKIFFLILLYNLRLLISTHVYYIIFNILMGKANPNDMITAVNKNLKADSSGVIRITFKRGGLWKK